MTKETFDRYKYFTVLTKEVGSENITLHFLSMSEFPTYDFITFFVNFSYCARSVAHK